MFMYRPNLTRSYVNNLASYKIRSFLPRTKSCKISQDDTYLSKDSLCLLNFLQDTHCLKNYAPSALVSTYKILTLQEFYKIL